MKLNGLITIELVLFAGFWIFVFGGGSSEFDTIIFFEPRFTYCLIAISILTGMLIGGLYERYHQEQQSKQLPVAKVE